MALTIGIIGLPQSGKTTLFNALTKANAPISGYATSTVQANHAVVQVPDARLQPLAEIFHPKKVTYATVEFVDVAGGLPAEDAARAGREGVRAGFLRADWYTHGLAILRLLQEALNDLRPVSQVELLPQDRAVLDELFLLTLKPRMYVLNVSEDVLGAANDLLARIAAGEDVDETTLEGELKGIAQIARRAKDEGSEVVAVSARLEAELAELPEEDAAEYLEALGLPKLGADRVIQVGYRLLNLITFLTAGEDEVRAWTVTKGAKAPEAAGKIHSDIERGFIRAEVTRFDDFMSTGSFAAASKKGLQRLEGKEYVIQDGDIAHFRFNVGK